MIRGENRDRILESARLFLRNETSTRPRGSWELSGRFPMSLRYENLMDTLAPRVLVVDDEDAIRDLLEYGLGSAGFSVRGVGHAHAALKAIDEWAPQTIILDVMLPAVDGYALLPM